MSAVERCTFNIAQVHFGVAHYHSYIVCSATEGRLGASDPPPGTKWRDWKEETNESVLTFDEPKQTFPRSNESSTSIRAPVYICGVDLPESPIHNISDTACWVAV